MEIGEYYSPTSMVVASSSICCGYFEEMIIILIKNLTLRPNYSDISFSVTEQLISFFFLFCFCFALKTGRHVAAFLFKRLLI